MSLPRINLSFNQLVNNEITAFCDDHHGLTGFFLKSGGKTRAIQYLKDVCNLSEEALVRKVYWDIHQEEGKGYLDTSKVLRKRLALALLTFLLSNITKSLSDVSPQNVSADQVSELQENLAEKLRHVATNHSTIKLTEILSDIHHCTDGSGRRNEGQQILPGALVIARKSLREILVEYIDHYLQSESGVLKSAGRERAERFKELVLDSQLTEYQLAVQVYSHTAKRVGDGLLGSSEVLRNSLMNALSEYKGLGAAVTKQASEMSNSLVRGFRYGAASGGGQVPSEKYFREAALAYILSATFSLHDVEPEADGVELRNLAPN